MVTQIEKLNELGFKTIHKMIKGNMDVMKNLHLAYQNHDFITSDDVREFRKKLKKATFSKKKDSQGYIHQSWETLQFTDVADYKAVPPMQILDKMQTAKDFKCFRVFQIAQIVKINRLVKPDPILFGRINGCTDLFIIAEWGNDVTVAAIRKVLKEGESE